MSATRVAVIGCGMIGRSWAISFARGGCSVMLYDPQDGIAAAALGLLKGQLAELESLNLLGGVTTAEVVTRLHVASSLAEGLEGIEHVQENAPETLELKRSLFAELDTIAPVTASIASSSSALLPSSFVPEGKGAARCLVAHPLNPPSSCAGGRARARSCYRSGYA